MQDRLHAGRRHWLGEFTWDVDGVGQRPLNVWDLVVLLTR